MSVDREGDRVFVLLVVLFTLLENTIQWWYSAALDRQNKLKHLYMAVLFICDGYVLPTREAVKLEREHE